MEHPSKRIKLSSSPARSKYTYLFTSTSRGVDTAQTTEHSDLDIRQDSHEQHHKHHHAHVNFHNRNQRPRAHQRDINVEPRSEPTTVIATATVVDVIVQDGTTEVAALTVANVPTVLTVGSAEITIGATTETIQIGSTSTSSSTNTASTQTTFSNNSSSAQSRTASASNSTANVVTSTSTIHTNSTITSTLSTPLTIVIGNSTSTILTSSSTMPPISSNSSSLTSSSRSITSSSSSASDISSTASSSDAAASSSTTAGSGSGSSSNSGSGSGTGPTTTIVGSVVGAVAGFALILLVLLWLLRKHRKRREGQQALPSEPGAGSVATTERTSQTSAATPFAAAIAPSLLGRWRQSGQSGQSDAAATSSEAAPSERGFQKLGGRKVTGVLKGGDPYGGNYGAFDKETQSGPSETHRGEGTLSGQSFYRDSQGFYGGDGADPTSPTMPIPTFAGGASATHDFAGDGHDPHEGLPVMRPSPARTPVRASPSITSLPRTPGSNAPSAARVHGQDGVGRTLSAHDGSRGSRFTEGV